LAVGVFLVLSFLVLSPNNAQVRPTGFEIPARLLPLGNAATPGEYAQLKVAIENWQREHVQAQEGEGLGDLSHIQATRVKLGSLGEGVAVSSVDPGVCGATGNCPMALFVGMPNGYRLVLMSGGWGYALLPSAGPVPDIAFYWHMSAAESDAQVFHYAHGEFVATGSAQCTAENSTNPVCAAVGNTVQTAQGALSPTEYDALRPAVEASLLEQSPASAQKFSFDDAHGIKVFNMQLVSATAIGMGPCGVDRNCDISIYAQHREGGTYWPLLRNVSGWGVTGGTLMHGFPTQVAFVVARHLSANQDLLTRYITPLATTSHFGDLTASSRLLPDACETVTPKSGQWPAEWNAAALVSQPVPCIATNSPEQSRTPPVDVTNIAAVAQDASGTVWAAGGSRSGQIYRWRNGGWSEVPGPIPPSSASPQQLEYLRANGIIPQPMGIWPGPNDGVLVDWLLDPSSQVSELFWQRGDQAKLLAAIPAVREGAHLDIETVAPAASGIVVITGDQRFWRNGVPASGQAPGIFRLDDNGHLTRIYTFALEQYLPYRSPVLPPFFAPLSTIRDRQGKIWIWCGWPPRRDPREAVLEGLLVTDGNTVQYHRQITGLSDAHLVSLDVWDSGHFAAATFGGGLYTIDIANFEVHPVSEPQRGAFRYVNKVFRAGDDRYVLTFEPSANDRLNNTPGAVWLLRDGQWQRVLPDLPDASGVGLATAGGLWLATSDFRGFWFIPANGSARRVGTQQDLPVTDVKQLFQLPDGHILATEAGPLAQTRSAELNPDTLLNRNVTSAVFTVIYPRTVLRPDQQRNLWGILQPGVLSEWNGAQWTPHPFPSEVIPSRIVSLDIDSRGRVWLFPNCQQGPMGTFDPVENRWTTYQFYRDALASSGEPVRFLHADDDWTRPIYGPNSQMVYVGMCWGVNYFDGSSWHLWNRQQLPGAVDIERPPFFDASGHLAFDPDRHARRPDEPLQGPASNAPTTWEWTPDSLWHNVSYQPGEFVPRPNPFAASAPPPAGCTTMSPSSLVQDVTGRAWWVAEDTLYTGTAGQCYPVSPGSGTQPFVDGRHLVRALLDARGNIFLETQAPFSYVILPRSVYAELSKTSAPGVK
jgi:hypothetical protein